MHLHSHVVEPPCSPGNSATLAGSSCRRLPQLAGMFLSSPFVRLCRYGNGCYAVEGNRQDHGRSGQGWGWWVAVGLESTHEDADLLWDRVLVGLRGAQASLGRLNAEASCSGGKRFLSTQV